MIFSRKAEGIDVVVQYRMNTWNAGVHGEPRTVIYILDAQYTLKPELSFQEKWNEPRDMESLLEYLKTKLENDARVFFKIGLGVPLVLSEHEKIQLSAGTIRPEDINAI